jgi:hypothetical protein
MANTTFSGPVRSQNGFETVSINSTTGTVTTTSTLGPATAISSLTVTGNAAFGDAATDTFGVYGKTPVAQPSSTGQTSGFTAGAGTAVLSDSTFTGGTGTKAYTIGDIVRHLKAVGIIASS